MEVLKKLRAPLRSSFTKVEKKLTELLLAEVKDLKAIELQFAILKDTLERIEKMNDKISAVLKATAHEELDDGSLAREMESVELYRNKFTELEIKTTRALRQSVKVEPKGESNLEATIRNLTKILEDRKMTLSRNDGERRTPSVKREEAEAEKNKMGCEAEAEPDEHVKRDEAEAKQNKLGCEAEAEQHEHVKREEAEAEQNKLGCEAEAEQDERVKRGKAEAEQNKLGCEAEAEPKKLEHEAKLMKMELDHEAEVKKLELDHEHVKRGEAEAEQKKLDCEAEAEPKKLDREAKLMKMELDQEAEVKKLELDHEAKLKKLDHGAKSKKLDREVELKKFDREAEPKMLEFEGKERQGAFELEKPKIEMQGEDEEEYWKNIAVSRASKFKNSGYKRQNKERFNKQQNGNGKGKRYNQNKENVCVPSKKMKTEDSSKDKSTNNGNNKEFGKRESTIDDDRPSSNKIKETEKNLKIMVRKTKIGNDADLWKDPMKVQEEARQTFEENPTKMKKVYVKKRHRNMILEPGEIVVRRPATATGKPTKTQPNYGGPGDPIH